MRNFKLAKMYKSLSMNTFFNTYCINLTNTFERQNRLDYLQLTVNIILIAFKIKLVVTNLTKFTINYVRPMYYLTDTLTKWLLLN